jgi:hypothetical protein
MATDQLAATEKPIRIGVFSTIADADRAVQSLLDAGFTKDQISVICSDPAKEAHFKRFEKEEPAGTYTLPASVTGGAIGAALGGLTALTGVVATGGIGLIGAGAIAAWAGGIFGGLIGAMSTRGVERETANYYDQAVIQGKILVAAEDHGPDQQARLAAAAHALAEAGAEPLPLREG